MRLSGVSIAVTGGAGFIGSHLVEELLRRGNHVTVLDSLATGRRENLPAPGSPGAERARLVVGDVRDPAALDQAFAGAEVVFHLATHCVRLSLNHPGVNHEVNVTGTLNALVAAKKAGVRRFVYCSSSEVFGNPPGEVFGGPRELRWSEASPKWPTTLYGASKLAGESYALVFNETYGLPCTVVRPFNAYGPRSHILGPYGEVIPRFAVLLRAGLQPTVFGDGLQTRDFTYVADTARGLAMAAEEDALVGDSVNIAHGEEVSILDLARHLSELTGANFRPRHLAERPGDIRRLGADVSKARRVLGWVPGTPVREGLARYLQWLDAQGHDYPALARRLTERNWEETVGTSE